MVSRVSYRPFVDDDFAPIAGILQEAWHDEDAPTPDYALLEASYDLARCLSLSTFSQVALVDREPRGIVLARSNALRTPVSKRWQRAQAHFYQEMVASEPTSAASYQHMSEEMERVNADLLRKSGIPAYNEITLLAVNSAARGSGIGGVLLDAAASYLASRGAHQAFLYTDTDCSWPFYEHHGLKRAAEHRAAREERKTLPRAMYLYGLDLSA